MFGGVDCTCDPIAGPFPFAFMPQGNGSEAPFRRWLKLTLIALTAINYAGQRGYLRDKTDG